jgi:hypothetical protein
MRRSLTFFLFFLNISLHASILPQRTELSLNGEWSFTPIGKAKTTISVPDYWDAHTEFKNIDRAIYEKKIEVPALNEWKSKIIKLEFEGVNFVTDVYINNKLVSSHIGGWIPFSVDITPYVQAGKSCQLKVDVKGGNYQPIVDESGNPQWPVGFIGQAGKWGIAFDVWLRAYGTTAITDAYVQTSYRKKELTTQYEVENKSGKTSVINIYSKVVSALDTGTVLLEKVSGDENIKAGERKIVSLSSDWTTARYWSPADPFLYYLVSEIIDVNTGKVLDRRYDRFGFREIWVEGNRLMFNGHPFTILGANIVQHSEFYDNQRYWYMTPETWNRTIDRLFELNLRTVRFHMQPAPGFILDMADERGLLIMDEASIYAREYILKSNKANYLDNCKKWIEPWVRARRNHASVIVWNAENEMGVGWLRWMTSEEMKSLGDAIRLYDSTRPVNYDGDRDVGDEMINLHYPERYKETVSGSIYAWADTVSKTKPTGVGEFITHYGESGNINQWWQGTWVRGMRYVYFSDIRPYRHDWAILRKENTPCIQNLKNSLSPVALFDKEYDDLGIDPLVNYNYPMLGLGETINRTLVLYNDEFEDTDITIEVLVKSSEIYNVLYHYNGDREPVQKIIARGQGTYSVGLGEHVDIPYSFVVPALAEGFADRCDVELIARKRGEVKFRETIKFNLRKNGFTGISSSQVILNEARAPHL